MSDASSSSPLDSSGYLRISPPIGTTTTRPSKPKRLSQRKPRPALQRFSAARTLSCCQQAKSLIQLAFHPKSRIRPLKRAYHNQLQNRRQPFRYPIAEGKPVTR